jgi:hypothetical protein
MLSLESRMSDSAALSTSPKTGLLEFVREKEQQLPPFAETMLAG